jgi:MFS family permease
VFGDLFDAESRGKAISIYSLMPLLGPAIGPILGGVVTERASWSWVFYSISIVDAVIQIGGFIILRETFAPVLLNKKRKRLVKETGNHALCTPYGDGSETLAARLKESLQRPLWLLITQPIVQFIAVFMVILYGFSYLILSSFVELWTSRYHESIEISGVNSIALALGATIGAQSGAIVTDLMYKKLSARNNGVERPEFRIPPMFVATLLVPIGLFWHGWSANATMFWLMPDIGISIFYCGLIICYIFI